MEKKSQTTKEAPKKQEEKKKQFQQGGGRGQGRRQGRKRPPQEFDQQVLDIARTARVIAGGRRFSFRAVVVAGDRKGRVGVGIGKGADVANSIGKAAQDARKNVITVPMTDAGTIPHSIEGKRTSSVVLLRPGREGRGIIAGGPVRVICDLAGYKDIVGKILSRSTNKLNTALATLDALERLSSVAPTKKKKAGKQANKKTSKQESK